MSVADILRSKGGDVITGVSRSTLRDICQLLVEHRIGAVLILGEGGVISGILSERDVVRAITVHGPPAMDRPVAEFMTEDVMTCGENSTIADVMERMTTGKFRHLPVVRNDVLVGLISIGDVVKHRIEAAEREAEEMRSYIAQG